MFDFSDFRVCAAWLWAGFNPLSAQFTIGRLESLKIPNLPSSVSLDGDRKLRGAAETWRYKRGIAGLFLERKGGC
jgi:hypothetical protein